MENKLHPRHVNTILQTAGDQLSALRAWIFAEANVGLRVPGCSAAPTRMQYRGTIFTLETSSLRLCLPDTQFASTANFRRDTVVQYQDFACKTGLLHSVTRPRKYTPSTLDSRWTEIALT
jgi:hypothetical protein